MAQRFEGAGLVRRARVIWLSARGVSGREIALRLDLTPEHVSVIRARARYEQGPLTGISVQVAVVASQAPPRQDGPAPVGSQAAPTAGRSTQVLVAASQVA